ncbi:MAG: bifunctional DNA-formamidopyrimidine glycosylase/DNA-(apurinic or apyrimidinic site) lyase [Hydrogenovibrio sp.]
MPELPEVETTRRGLQPKVEGQVITDILIRNSRLRWPVDESLRQKLPGLAILSIQRRAKYLLLQTQKGHLIIHLGMSGNLRVLPKGTPPLKHDHIDLILDNGYRVRYHDPRRFGCWLWTEDPPEAHPLLTSLGPEPLSDDFNADYLWQTVQGRKRPIKTLIMTNSVVVGVGNIYANESLFLSRIHPARPAASLSQQEIETLVRHIKQVLEAAILQGGTTLKDFLSPSGQPGYFEQTLHVYGRAGQPCTQCATPIEKVLLNQRAAYFCPSCQAPPPQSAPKRP